MKTQGGIMAALTIAAALLTAKNEQFQAWFMSLPVFWMVMVCVGAFSIIVLLLMRAFGELDIFTTIGL